MTSGEEWVRVFNGLFQMMDETGAPTYYSGGRFISKMREVDPLFPDYTQYIDLRKQTNKSTSRRSYYYDILRDFDEQRRVRILQSILNDLEPHQPVRVRELRAILGGAVPGPIASIGSDVWSSDRLARFLDEIDDSITNKTYERAVTLSYTCLEGYYKAFVHKRIPSAAGLSELIELAREIKRYISSAHPAYPPEVLNMIGHVSHAIDRARNRMSESHFDSEAARWLAVYVRDLLNTQIRLLMHFFDDHAA